MKKHAEGTIDARHELRSLVEVRLLPYTVFALSLAVTFLFWQLYDHSLKTRAQLIFEDKAEEIQSRIARRLHENEQVLRGGAGLFNASDEVSRDEWHRYFSTLNLSENYPGIQGMGFSKWIKPEERTSHIKKIRSEGFPQYTITPEGERPEYTAILYLEPFNWRNQRAFGYDMFSEPIRHAAMERSRDSGETSISGKITLVQETDKDRQNGFLIYVPIYRRGVALDTVELRRRALIGFAYSPIRVKDFILATLNKMPTDIAFEIFASKIQQSDNLLFSSTTDKSHLPEDYSPEFLSEQKLEMFGQTWLIKFQSLPPFEKVRLQGQSFVVLAGGVAVSILLAMIAFMLRSSRDKALSIAKFLKESQERLSFHVDNSPMATIEWDSDFVVTRWAGEADKIFGWKPSETIGKHIMDLQMIYEEDIPIVQDTMRRLTNGSEKYVVGSNRNYTKDRKVVVCDWYNTVLTNEQGQMVSVLSQVLDVTERKLTEQFQEMARDILQILNEPSSLDELLIRTLTALRLHTGFDAVGIRLKHGDDFPYVAAEGFSKDFLLSENSLFAPSVNEDICQDEYGNVLLECACGLVISGKTDPTNPLFTARGSCWANDSSPLIETPNDADLRLHPRNKCIHQGYTSIALVPIRDGGKIVGLIQLNDKRKNCFTLEMVERLEDIAQYIGAVLMRKRLEDERLDLLQQYQQAQKLESLGVLAGGIAHDFNNILMAIIGNIDLALMKLAPDSPIVGNLHNAEHAANRAADLAKQMLAYSGKGRFVIQQINLNSLLEDSPHMLEAVVSPNVELRFNLYPELPTVDVDTTQIRQIIINLLVNASEALEEKNGLITVSTGVMDCKQDYLKEVWLNDNIPEGRYVYLDITDSGCGIAPDNVTKIFDPFFSTKFTGRGLGLAAVLGIVRGHKGAIKVNSELGKGTTIRILLPVSEPANQPDEVNSSDRAAWCGSGKIMLVDDEEDVRNVAGEMFRELGFEVVTADNGRKAIETFLSNPDIVFVILDLTMPVMDGEECLRELLHIKPDVEVFLSSGFNESDVKQRFAGKGLAGFIQKPYRMSVLLDVLAKYINN